MISFKQFISEEADKFERFNFDKFEKECSNILSQYKSLNKVLYHGMKWKNQDPIWYNIRWEKRKSPKDTPVIFHDAMNASFKSKFGDECRNWHFCTNSLAQSKEYGAAFVLFPVGECEFVFSSEVKDVTLTISKDTANEGDFKDGKAARTWGLQYAEELRKNFAERFDYKKTSNIAPIFGNKLIENEAMFKCERYYLIKQASPLYYEIERRFL